jgi:LmbE family N-acetylglucosaminyl deacetylase
MRARMLFAPAVAAAVAFAQPPYFNSIRPTVNQQELSINRGSAALWQSLKKLHTRASILWLAAHPDDEDGSVLAYESRGLGARVVLSQSNRGEGGANVMSDDYFDALGLVRTMELLKADEYYGVEQRWSMVVDYGFSKTLAETFKNWTHDRYFWDIVRIVRMERPLIIVTSHPDSPAAGHGNHQATGRVAVEVMKAAGDPNVFPDQIQAGLRPWTPLKGYARGGFGGAGRGGRAGRGGQADAPNVEVPVGAYDPLLGASYAQIAREGLGFQKSQNGGPSIPQAGEMMAGYRRFASVLPASDKEESFFDGVDISLAGIATLAKGGDTAFLTVGLRNMNTAVEDAISKFSATQPERTAPALATGLRETIQLLDLLNKSNLSADSKADIRHELEIKRAQFNNALSEALGLSVSAAVALPGQQGGGMEMFLGDLETSRTVIPGQSFNVSVHAVNPSGTPVKLERVSLETEGQKQAWDMRASAPAPAGDLAGNKPVQAQFTVKVPDSPTYTRPYFSRPNIEQSWYDILDNQYRNQSFAPYPLAAWLDVSYDGVPIRVGQYVQTSMRVTGMGTVYEPLIVAPAIGVAISPRNSVVPLGSKSFSVMALVHSNVKGPVTGSIKLELPAGWKSAPISAPFAIAADNQEQSATFEVTPARLSEQEYKLTAVAEYVGKEYREGYTVTGYPGVRPYFLYRASQLRATGVDVKVAPGLKVAYIAGTGDDVPAALEPLGVKVTFLSPEDVATADLSKFDVILLGVRTYAARDDLRIHNNRLIEYVKDGGVVIVQYNTPEFDHNYGPYPYVMGRNPEEVTDEASKVTILKPANPVFNWPNKITEKDFTGWVEERGSKWMQSWDSHYEALLETHDEGQAPQSGGLLYAKYGKGIYIYNAYAFYRQLPEGVPGAYRIFANMISLAKNPQR